MLCVMAAAPVFAQATSTFNGRILDQGDAVLPGVTVTATNVSTGVMRTTVTNAEGLYSIPGLEPGTYEIVTDLAGFAAGRRANVRLDVNATITVDFKLALAGLQETLTVTGQAPLIETTQSKVANTIETTEVQNLPMITRTISGMLELLPGASPVAPLHRTKENVGTVSYGGSLGGNVAMNVDGADNRDNHYSGPLLTFTTESLEQFQLASSQFTAVDGRTGGAAVTLVTKSGTNVLHGSAFGYERDRKLTSKDFFTQEAKGEKAPFSRQQFGGSIGGPIVQNRMFFFGALEQQLEEKGIFVPERLYNELDVLVRATSAGQVPSGMVNPSHPKIGEQPGRLLTYSAKGTAQLNNTHSLMFRYSGQDEGRDSVTWTNNNDDGQPDDFTIKAYSAVGQHSWVLGNSGLNQITGQVNHIDYLADVWSRATGEHYTRDFPKVNIFAPRLSFPSVTTGAGGDAGTLADRYVFQIKDDVSLLQGNHSIKTGFNFNYLRHLGILNGNEHYATLTFFDDPSVIANNSNGRYPQGFRTPGIVRQWQQGNGGALNGNGYWADTLNDVRQLSGWFQDDWRATPQLTLNLGVRYDVDLNLMDEKNFSINATRQALEAIGSPFGGYPKTPKTDVSPRVGFAYDLRGDGRRVLRGGYGLYFDQYNTAAAAGDITSQARRPLNALATLTNTAIGVGQLATYRLGIDPLPPQPTEGNRLPLGSQGQWIDVNMVDPRTHQAHVGYAHELAANTTVAVDFTHVEGRKEKRITNINPILGGRRRLADDFQRVFGAANYLSDVRILAGINESRYDALTVLFRRRMPRMTVQAHYTLAGSYSYGGSTGNRSGAALAQDWDKPFADSEWGPNGPDERHRFVFTGVIEAPFGVQLSPVVQWASARAYNLTAGSDLNADGTNNDRWVDPKTAKQVSINTARGDQTFVFDMRTTKFIGAGERKLGIFVEFFNLFNTVNFGNAYNGNGRSSLFRQPNGYMPSIGYPRQVQLGARFLF
ncbi:MAG: TonB-dependent receptor [Acidobacteria bacterium]|nr:TonB-dependent receptor [Acidobacteriota bacterium]